jgi:competence protein ComEC
MKSVRLKSHLWFALGLCVVSLGLFAYVGIRPDDLSHIYFFDVGQGDASLIVTSDDQTILIDGGPSDVVVDRLAEVLPPWHRHIDLVILTHPHADHVTGLSAVLDDYHVGEFWFNGSRYDSATYQNLLAKIDELQIPKKIVTIETKRQLGAATIDVIGPATVPEGISNLNKTSLVFSFKLGDFQVLFAGDAESSNETEMLSRGVVPNIDVIKVPHHGSRTSSSLEFIRAADPEVGAIMLGADNEFGHPHAETLERYQTIGAQLYRTDQDGTIEVVTDGVAYQVQD